MAFGADAMDSNHMAAIIAEGELIIQEGDNVDAVTQDFLRKLLAKNPSDRLTAQEIKAHAYFNGVYVAYPLVVDSSSSSSSLPETGRK